MTSAQDRLQNLADQLVDQGRERGLQLAVYHKGNLVIDVSAGVCDASSARRVKSNTLFPVFSVGKGFAATIIHRLVARGVFSYETRVADLWPEFGTKGKEATLIRHVLNHSAGVPYMPASIGFADLCDWPTMCSAIANLSPAWVPGTNAEYHSMTYGWLVGEVAQRATGKSFPQLLDEEIRRPLGLEAVYMGLPESLDSRVATLEDNPAVPAPPSDPFREPAPRWTRPLGETLNRADIRRACHPGFGTLSNAVSVARHYAALLPGGVNGVELLAPECVRFAIQPQGTKNSAGEDFRWLLGYHTSEEVFNPAHAPNRFGHDGYGGAFAFADLARNLGVGCTRNLFIHPDSRALMFSILHELFPPT